MTRTLRLSPFLVLFAALLVAGVLAPLLRAQERPAEPADETPARQPLLVGEEDANNPTPTPVLPGRPDDSAPVGDLLGEPYESLGIGIALRPPKGSVVVRRHGTNEAVEFVDRERGWTLKVSKTMLAEPMEITAWRDPKGRDRQGLLDITVSSLKRSLPKATILRKDVANIGDGDMGMIALRYTDKLKTLLTQQAIIQATDRLYYVMALTTPGRTDDPTGEAKDVDEQERRAVETFAQVLDSVRLLDRAALRREQEERLFRTRALFLNFTEERLQTAMIPQQWMRVIHKGKDVGYTYVIEESAAGIPRPLTDEERRAGKPRPDPRPGDGILVGIRSRKVGPKGGRVDAEAWMYVTTDDLPEFRHEDWSRLTVIDPGPNGDFGFENVANVAAVGPAFPGDASQRAADAAEEEEQKADKRPYHGTEFGSSDRRRVRGSRDDYVMNVTHIGKSADPEPLTRELPPFYLPHPVAHLLPRLLPLGEPKTYLFAVYVSDSRELMLRYVDVKPEGRVVFNGRTVRAVPIDDRLGVEGSVTTHYMSPEGEYLGSENKDAKLMILPTDEQTLRGLWADADLNTTGVEQPGPAARREDDDRDDNGPARRLSDDEPAEPQFNDDSLGGAFQPIGGDEEEADEVPEETGTGRSWLK